MTGNLRPIPAAHPYLGGPRGTVRLMPGPRCARARGRWLEEALEPEGGSGGSTLRYEAANDTAYWPIAIGLKRREEGLSPSFFKAMSRPPRNQGRTAGGIPPWKASRMRAMSARAPLPGTKAALTSKVSMARECLALPASN